jgi:hypothetical protein
MQEMTASVDRLVGRDAELRRLQTAVRKRQSQLVWGPTDAGKTVLVKKVLAELPEIERRKCICWTGPASRRELIEEFIRGLYLANDPFVRRKVHADRCSEISLGRWINAQSALRLRGIMLTATEQGEYRFFVDHLPPASHTIAQLLKEVMYRTKTPVYLTGQGYTQAEIGYAWSLYWTDEYRIRLGPLSDAPARELLETCIRSFGLGSLDLGNFREEVLHLSKHLPGSIVKMCELAAHPRYHYGDQVKVKLIHVDYLLQGSRFPSIASHL